MELSKAIAGKAAAAAAQKAAAATQVYAPAICALAAACPW